MSIEPIFTRYLYDVSCVKLSLEGALLDCEVEEALFWAYELYHSGFQEDAWAVVRDVYSRHYRALNPRYEKWLNQFYGEWVERNAPQLADEGNQGPGLSSAPPEIAKAQTTERDCLLGSAVHTLAIRNWRERKPEKYVIICKYDKNTTEMPPNQAYKYLEEVSRFGVRRLEDSETTPSDRRRREAYLGGNWLYYCRKSPVWLKRILDARGRIDDVNKTVAFESDDDLEAFYDVWGLEPDEQCVEMHNWHGVYLENA